jgi:hypothetical protein
MEARAYQSLSKSELSTDLEVPRLTNNLKDDELRQIYNKAVFSADQHRCPPLVKFPSITSEFWHDPAENSADPAIAEEARRAPPATISALLRRRLAGRARTR